QRSTSVQDCKVTFRNGFNLESNEIRNRMFSRRRIPEQIPTVLSRKVQTVMECLDACLRSDRCVSFDVEAKPLQLKVCRIFGEVESMLPLVEGGNSIHVNLSSKLLRQMLRSATNDCNGMERDGKTNQPILSTQANLDSYCATEAPNLGGCKHKKAHNGSCSGKWTAKIIKTRWCCVDLTHPSQNCCCEIPI
ncbi:unnamed protein product, partial [Porites lobata]